MAQLLLTFHHASNAAAAHVMACSRTLKPIRAPTLRARLEALSMSGWPLPVDSAAVFKAPQFVLERVAYCHAHGCACLVTNAQRCSNHQSPRNAAGVPLSNAWCS